MRMVNAGRLWRIAVDGRTSHGRKIKIDIIQKGVDAGEAWLCFAQAFSGAKWERISVTEVMLDERNE